MFAGNLQPRPSKFPADLAWRLSGWVLAAVMVTVVWKVTQWHFDKSLEEVCSLYGPFPYMTGEDHCVESQKIIPQHSWINWVAAVRIAVTIVSSGTAVMLGAVYLALGKIIGIRGEKANFLRRKSFLFFLGSAASIAALMLLSLGLGAAAADIL